MKTNKILSILISTALFALTGCCYYTHLPETGTVCKRHGRSYVKHFVEISESKNRGAYFTRDTLEDVLNDNSGNGVNVFIGCEDTVHPLIMELANGDQNKFEIKKPKKCYLSSAYVKHACFNKNDQNCVLINNYSNQGQCELNGAYFPKTVIQEILKHKKYTGIVIYIGSDAANHYPLIMQGTETIPTEINISSTYSVISRTYCPKVCGTMAN